MNYLRFLGKTYLLEFLINGKAEDSIAFSVPPQSEEFNFPQRISETKTFGGVVIDNYGSDTIKISLSGSTLNQDFKYILRSTKPPTMYNGEQEVFKIKKMIEDYNNKKNSTMQTVLYDLSSSRWWEGVVSDFQIRRSKDNPFAYFYTLTFTAFPFSKLKRFIPNVLSNVFNGLDKIMNIANMIAAVVGSVSDIIALITSKVQDCKKILEKYYSLISGLSNEFIEIQTESIKLGETTIETGKTIWTGLKVECMNFYDDLRNVTNKYMIDIVDMKPEDIPVQEQERLNKTATEILDSYTILANELQNEVNNVVTIVKKEFSQVGYTAIVDDEGNENPVITYGYSEHTVKDSDTWDSLAKNFYGDPSLAGAISFYNANEIGIKELKVGQKILMPKFEQEIQTDNQVYQGVDKKDNYGADVKISKNGDISVKNNDIESIEGIENLGQAIKNRLTTSLGSRIRTNTYGLKTQIGEPTITKSYIESSLENTLLADPRIENIESIKFMGKREQIQIDIEYVDINDTQQQYGGMF